MAATGDEQPVMQGVSMRAPRHLPFHARFWPMVFLFCAVAVAGLLLVTLPGARDYVGADNDDVMRLVEVRDLLGGQGWFDMMQHRLGLADGTLMHWSRFIDLPIAALISVFRLFADQTRAEAIALAIWPPLTAVALILAMGTAGWRIGGALVMTVTLGFTVIFLVTSNRFLPGSIDHHNVQLVLIATIVAVLIDPRRRPREFALAGLASALAIAVGAETTPHVAVACAIVACLWAWHGEKAASAASAFALALALGVSAAFFLTVPPHLYKMVTCDNLSLGFYALSAGGGALLFAAAFLGSGLSRGLRFAALGAIGAAVVIAAKVVAPQCLGNPLASLDPLLVDLWLSRVAEAKSALAQFSEDPATIGSFYALGLIAIVVCGVRMARRDRVELHLILLAVIATSWAIGLVQLRGVIYSNLLGILPMALAIIDLRTRAHLHAEDRLAGLGYLLLAVVSVPPVWGLGGILAVDGPKGFASRTEAAETTGLDCTSASALAPLAQMPPGVVAAPSELGVHILRYTQHRVLSAPYHRNQGGMLTELHIGLSNTKDAESFLRGAGVDILAYCDDDAQTQMLANMRKDGIYAALHDNRVPPYLEDLGRMGGSDLRLFRVRPLSP